MTATADQHRIALTVEGMTCDNCVRSVRSALDELSGVDRVEVDVETGQVVVVSTADAVDADAARSRIEAVGYRVASGEPHRRWSPLRLLLAGLVVAVAGSLLFRFGSDALFESGTLSSVSDAIDGTAALGLPLAFALGVLVAFAPPTYAMAPAVMGYVTGSGATSRAAGLRLSVAFVAGIVAVDVLLGAAFGFGGTAVIGFISSRLVVLYFAAALVLLAIAAVNFRWWRPTLPSFSPRLQASGTTGGAFLVGVPFALMACPGCTPLLLPVALGAATSGSALYGAALMGAFALGRGIPLVVLGTFTATFERALGATRLVREMEVVVGALLLVGAAWFLSKFFQAGGPSAMLGL